STPLVAERNGLGGVVIALNFFAPSTNIRSDFWVYSTNGKELMGNAMNYAAGGLRPLANSITVLEGGNATVTTAMLEYNFGQNPVPASQVQYTLVSHGAHTEVQKNNTMVQVNGTFTQADIDGG